MNRLFKEGFMTTLLGVCIIIASIGMVFTNKATLVEISGWLALSLTFLRSKDTLIGIK